jgi:hypothetical protein
MKQLKWILGFLFALLITFGLINVFVYFDTTTSIVERNMTNYIIYHLFMQITSSFLFAFLSCYFVPSQKNYAGILAITVSLLVFALGLYLNFTDKRFPGYIDIRVFINFIGIITGLAMGLYISYLKFKNKGWSTPKSSDN